MERTMQFRWLDDNKPREPWPRAPRLQQLWINIPRAFAGDVISGGEWRDVPIERLYEKD
jgi:hypothetical protein